MLVADILVLSRGWRRCIRYWRSRASRVHPVLIFMGFIRLSWFEVLRTFAVTGSPFRVVLGARSGCMFRWGMSPSLGQSGKSEGGIDIREGVLGSQRTLWRAPGYLNPF